MPAKTKPAKEQAPDIVLVPLDELIPNPRNANQHSAEQVGQIAGSILSFGWTDPIIIWKDKMIIAGHGRRLAAMSLKLKEVPCIDCSYMSEADARAFAIAHNRIARNATFDLELLGAELRELGSNDFSLTDLGFNQAEIDEAFKGLMEGGEEDEDRYTQKVEAPIYEPTGERPSPNQLFDYDKTHALIREIDEADVPDDIKQFLCQAATRHTVFNYALIAEFYAHADQATQELMERSALVVIDYDQAVEDGFVKLADAVNAHYADLEKTWTGHGHAA